ncbi:MAG: 50S ribosomal protein L21 [Candidatus Eisenbacteria bacterium]|nr:50S ribosomal protein L21 [Candidatus Eisenbacteria bacterium]
MLEEDAVEYAIVRTGGLQYRVSAGETVRVPRVNADVGGTVELGEVLAVSRGGTLTVGTPLVENARVLAEVVAHGLGGKVLVFKKKRKKGYQVKKGHRQGFTEVRIRDISV